MRSMLLIGAIGALSACHGDLSGSNPLESIDVTKCPVALGKYREGSQYEMAFDARGMPGGVTTATTFVGFGIASSGTSGWTARTNPVTEILSVGTGATATDAMVVAFNPGVSNQTLVIGSFLNQADPNCIDTNGNNLVDGDEGNWKSQACWYQTTNYLAGCDWAVPDVSDELGLEGAQFSLIIDSEVDEEENTGLYPAETSI